MELTKNVMQLNNVSIGEGKQITFVDVVFNDNAVVKYISPARYIKSNKPSSASSSSYIYTLLQTYTEPLNIGSAYNNGAKYLYGVFPYFRDCAKNIVTGGDNALGLAESLSTTTNIRDFATPYDIDEQALTNGRKHIKHLAVDEAVFKNAQTGEALCDLVLSEVVLDLKTYYDAGVRYIWIPRVVAETQTVNGYSVTPVNTVDKPVAYFIYEN